MSNSLQPHGLQLAKPPCLSPAPRVYSNSCPLSRWCCPTISSSVVPFSSCPQSFPASGLFQMSQLFTSGGQSIGVSASTSVLPMNIQDWFPLEWKSYSLTLVIFWVLLVTINITGHLMWRADSLEKTLMLGKIEGRRRSARQRMRWLDGITDSMDMSSSKLWELVMDRQGSLACCRPWSKKVGHNWATKLNLNSLKIEIGY